MLETFLSKKGYELSSAFAAAEAYKILAKNHQTTKLAGIFAKKHQIDFLSRGFLFFTPPLLGYLLTQDALDILLKIFVCSSFITLVVTFFQSTWLLKKLQYHFQLIFLVVSF